MTLAQIQAEQDANRLEGHMLAWTDDRREAAIVALARRNVAHNHRPRNYDLWAGLVQAITARFRAEGNTGDGPRTA